MSCIMQMMAHIWRVWCHKKSRCAVIYTVCVMTQIVTVMSHVKCICCPHTGCGFIYSGCDIISSVGWWHMDWVWCYIQFIRCHTEVGCDVIQKCVRCQWRWCDDKDTVSVMSDTGAMFSAWSGCDIINIVDWCERVGALSSAVQRMSYICWLFCHQHRMLWCHT